MRNVKQFVVILLVVILCVCLIGCGKSKQHEITVSAETGSAVFIQSSEDIGLSKANDSSVFPCGYKGTTFVVTENKSSMLGVLVSRSDIDMLLTQHREDADFIYTSNGDMDVFMYGGEVEGTRAFFVMALDSHVGVLFTSDDVDLLYRVESDLTFRLADANA